MICVKRSKMTSAASTPSTPRTVSRRAASIGARDESPKSPSMTVANRTRVSTASVASANSSSKVRSMVSVSTRVPARNDTPSRTAENVEKRRRRWAPRFLSVSFSTRRPYRHIARWPIGDDPEFTPEPR
jgi:hypothetical protein